MDADVEKRFHGINLTLCGNCTKILSVTFNCGLAKAEEISDVLLTDDDTTCKLCRLFDLKGKCTLYKLLKFNDIKLLSEFNEKTPLGALLPTLSFNGKYNLNLSQTTITKGFNFSVLAYHLLENVTIGERFKNSFFKNILNINIDKSFEQHIYLFLKEHNLFPEETTENNDAEQGGSSHPTDPLVFTKVPGHYSGDTISSSTNEVKSEGSSNVQGNCNEDISAMARRYRRVDADVMVRDLVPKDVIKNSILSQEKLRHDLVDCILSRILESMKEEVLSLLVSESKDFKDTNAKFYEYIRNVCSERLLFEQLIRMKFNILLSMDGDLKLLNCSLEREVITFTGDYNKYVRGLSQCIWILDNTHKTLLSIEECIGIPMMAICSSEGYKFMASGREDCDVRTIRKGRKFCIELYSSKRDLFDVYNIIHKLMHAGDNVDLCKYIASSAISTTGFTSPLQVLSNQDVTDDEADVSKESTDLLMSLKFVPGLKCYNAPGLRVLESSRHKLIDYFRKNIALNDVSVRFNDMKLSFNNRLERQKIQREAEDKIKVYNCLVLANEDVLVNSRINVPFKIRQKNPLRTSHRRSQDVRERIIYKIEITLLHQKLFLLVLTTQAGTYVKEFISGDIGRTSPSLRSILKCDQLDVLSLDVIDIY